MVRVARHTILTVPPAIAWTLVRDFGAMADWNDMVKSSRIENGPADQVGCRRVLAFVDDGVWIHELTGLSDPDMTLTYRIVGMPTPTPISIRNYSATLSVRSESAGKSCRVDWSAEFDTDDIEEMVKRAGQVFERGFEGLRRRLLA